MCAHTHTLLRQEFSRKAINYRLDWLWGHRALTAPDAVKEVCFPNNWQLTTSHPKTQKHSAELEGSSLSIKIPHEQLKNVIYVFDGTHFLSPPQQLTTKVNTKVNTDSLQILLHCILTNPFSTILALVAPSAPSDDQQLHKSYHLLQACSGLKG